MTTYGYDDLDRLTSADHPMLPAPLDTLPSLETFTYDGVGNRTMSEYAHDANHRMRASPGHTYDYDDDGNTKMQDPGVAGQATYTWDLDNRLGAYASGATSAAYEQDPFARRFHKTVGSTTTWYLWSGDQLLAEYGGTGTRSTRYTRLDGLAPAQMAVPNGGSELIHSLHVDRLETPRMMTSSGGSVVWQAAYEVYGKAHISTGLSTPMNARLPGQYLDSESGSHYNRHRQYDSIASRYLSSDPVGQAAGVNLYGYVDANPVNRIDPLGLQAWELDAFVMGLGVATSDPSIGVPPGPPPDWHVDRNRHNRCPRRQPNTCSSSQPPPDGPAETWRPEPELLSLYTWFKGGGVGTTGYRGSAGSECYYDSSGNLILDAGTFNYEPDPSTRDHIVHDVIPALVWPGSTRTDLTTVY